ncbi:MAG: ATP-binding protein [Nanoarchaeota archaeon]
MIDRTEELGLLETAWKKNTSEFIVLYGRRRIGKSKLIQEFIKNKEGVYFIAEDINKKVQITELKNVLANYFNDDFLRRTEINEWRDLFDYLQKIIPSDKRFCLAIDEFSYLIKNDPAILSSLQKFWDLFLSKTKIFFIVSGSLFGLMTEQVLSAASPLYGRRTRDILLTQLRYKDAFQFLNMNKEEKFKVFFAIGGVPEYMLKATAYKNSNDFFTNEFFQKNGYFYREPHFLFSQEFKEIRTYFTIVNAISFGNTKPNEIANFGGMKHREIYPYLENLIRLGFIKKEISILGKRKEGIYLIKDQMFDFWFNFVYNNRENIEKNNLILKIDTSAYFGKRFEILVREEIAPQLFSNYNKIGRWWYQDKEIDIVALNEEKKEILFAECKWSNINYGEAKKNLEELKEKSKFVNWQRKKEYFCIIAKKLKDKQKLRKEGYLAFDLEDF